jgi:hypothetical protein
MRLKRLFEQRSPIYKWTPGLTPAHSHTLRLQLVAQHARAHERMLQVQLIDSAHEHQVGRAHRLGQMIDAAPADVRRLAWRVMLSLWSRSIMAFRSAIPLR